MQNFASLDIIAFIEINDCILWAIIKIFFKETSMASITIRNLDDSTKQRLRVRAAEHGRSMEEEARDILRKVVEGHSVPTNLASSIRGRLSSSVRMDLDLPPRDTIREPDALVAKKR